MAKYSIFKRLSSEGNTVLDFVTDIVKISWHIFLKDITDYAARSKVL